MSEMVSVPMEMIDIIRAMVRDADAAMEKEKLLYAMIHDPNFNPSGKEYADAMIEAKDLHNQVYAYIGQLAQYVG